VRTLHSLPFLISHLTSHFSHLQSPGPYPLLNNVTADALTNKHTEWAILFMSSTLNCRRIWWTQELSDLLSTKTTEGIIDIGGPEVTYTYTQIHLYILMLKVGNLTEIYLFFMGKVFSMTFIGPDSQLCLVKWDWITYYYNYDLKSLQSFTYQ